MLSYNYNRTEINWGLISKAISFYKARGYDYVEVPWIVSKEAIEVTFVGESTANNLGKVVGSAEQSFIQMMMDGELDFSKKYVAASPCFRREEKFDGLHFPYFFKVELICFSERDASLLLEDAICFFTYGVGLVDPFSLVNNTDSKDINLNGIEIGSYGWRQFKEFRWYYGTGLAEPRYSIAEKHL